MPANDANLKNIHFTVTYRVKSFYLTCLLGFGVVLFTPDKELLAKWRPQPLEKS
jgi:hypothetical protein